MGLYHLFDINRCLYIEKAFERIHKLSARLSWKSKSILAQKKRIFYAVCYL